MQFSDFLSRIRFAPADGQGGDTFFMAAPAGEGEGEQPADPPAGDPPADGGDPPPDAGQADEVPDWLFEKFHVKTEDGKLDMGASLEKQAQSYRELYGKFSTKTEALKAEVMEQVKAEYGKEIGVPDDPAEYSYPEGWQAPAEAVDGAMRAWAKKHNVSGEGFTELVNEVWAKTQPDMEAERKALGENADQRIGAVNRFLAKNVPAEMHGALSSMMTSAASIEVMEKLIAVASSNNFAPDEGDMSQKPLTREEIRKEQADPRYLTDPTYQAYIAGRWAAYAKQAERAGQRGF